MTGIVKLDSTFTNINLIGTKSENMPRISKVRGKSKTHKTNKHARGISNHKVCLITAIDEWGTILFEVAGNGAESNDIGSMHIQEIDYRILQTYFNLRSDYGKESNEDIKRALNRIFVYAIKADYLRTNPLQYVKITGVENKKKSIS